MNYFLNILNKCWNIEGLDGSVLFKIFIIMISYAPRFSSEASIGNKKI